MPGNGERRRGVCKFHRGEIVCDKVGEWVQLWVGAMATSHIKKKELVDTKLISLYDTG